MGPAESLERPTRDRRATKARLLAAAREEFAEFGLAGARIDRISANAAANKRLLYAYLGNKQAIFAAVVTECVAELNTAVPFTVENLPDYAGQIFDFFVDHQMIHRVLQWRDLEGANPTPIEVEGYNRRIKLITAAQRNGSLDNAYAPHDLIAIIEATITSWLNATVGLRVARGASAGDRLAENRRAIVETVRRITWPDRG